MANSGKSRILIAAIVIVVLVGGLLLLTGVFDYIPRLRAHATSPDGALTVRVYQKRLMPRPFFPRMGAVVEVYDRNGNLVYQNTFFRDSDFDDTLADAFKQISFAGDEIVIGPGFYDSRLVYIIQRSTMTGRYQPVPPSNTSLDRSADQRTL